MNQILTRSFKIELKTQSQSNPLIRRISSTTTTILEIRRDNDSSYSSTQKMSICQMKVKSSENASGLKSSETEMFGLFVIHRWFRFESKMVAIVI